MAFNLDSYLQSLGGASNVQELTLTIRFKNRASETVTLMNVNGELQRKEQPKPIERFTRSNYVRTTNPQNTTARSKPNSR